MRMRRGMHAILAAALCHDWSILQTALTAQLIVRLHRRRTLSGRFDRGQRHKRRRAESRQLSAQVDELRGFPARVSLVGQTEATRLRLLSPTESLRDAKTASALRTWWLQWSGRLFG